MYYLVLVFVSFVACQKELAELLTMAKDQNRLWLVNPEEIAYPCGLYYIERPWLNAIQEFLKSKPQIAAEADEVVGAPPMLTNRL
jgi:hypothetical protein